MNIAKSNSNPVFYFDNLDSLRFFAFLFVFVSHAALFLGYENSSHFFTLFKEYVLVNGDIGVSFFFVLSGFLITYLLFKEKDENNEISLKKFYIRRILRIWPVYFLTLFIGFFVLPLFLRYFLGDTMLPFLTYPSLSFLPSYLFFLANFSLAFRGGVSVPADVLWSISVEEQFYLVWPFFVSFLKRRYIPWFLCTVIFCSSLYRFFYASSSDVIAYSTFSVMSDLAIGALLSWFVYTKHTLIKHLKKIHSSFIFLLYMLIPMLIIGRHFLLRQSIHQVALHSFFVISIPLILACLYAFVIFEQNESSYSFFKMKSFKKASFLGKISYGMYAYHMIAFSLVLTFFWKVGVSIKYDSWCQWLVFSGVAFALTLILALFSYFFIERFFLKYKPT